MSKTEAAPAVGDSAMSLVANGTFGQWTMIVSIRVNELGTTLFNMAEAMEGRPVTRKKPLSCTACIAENLNCRIEKLQHQLYGMTHLIVVVHYPDCPHSFLH